MWLRKEYQDEIYGRKERGEGYIGSKMQWVNAPELVNKLLQKKFRIKRRFSHLGDSGKNLLY